MRLLDLAAGEGGEAPAAPAAQVWVVTEGRVTIFLGAQQARIVRAGDVVRIPAGAAWRYANTGAGRLRIVAVEPSRPPE